jgi:hypothetical protein
MNRSKQKRLEAAGWKVGDTKDFLDGTGEAVERVLDQLIIEGLESGRSRTSLKTFLKRMHRWLDGFESPRPRSKRTREKTARPNARR